MTLEEKKYIAQQAERLLNNEISYDRFRENIPSETDDDIARLLDLIEHEPSEKTVWGGDNKKFHAEHVETTRQLIDKILGK